MCALYPLPQHLRRCLSQRRYAAMCARQNTKRQITLSQQRALTELDGRLREIGTSLKKGVYSSTPPMLSGMASELSRETLAAKSSLSVLPLENTNLENTYKFLSQVGDFTETLNRKVASGESISDEERENLRSLITFCDALSGEVSNIRADMFDGSFSFSQKSGELALTGEKTEYLAGDMEDAQQSLSDYPTLIYDGPFSDHIMSAQPKMTSGAKEISKENALDAAAAFLGCDKKEISFLSEESGNVPAYCFSHNNKTVAVTKSGGYVIYMLDSSFAGEAKLKTADALKKASEFFGVSRLCRYEGELLQHVGRGLHRKLCLQKGRCYLLSRSHKGRRKSRNG